MEVATSSLAILLLIALGLPVVFSFLIGTLLFVAVTGAKTGFITSVAYQSMDSFALMAIPFYLVAGEIMSQGGIASRLIAFASALLAKTKSGLGSTIPLASMFFGALCGSGTATAAAIGSILIPKLEKYGWDRRYTAALTAASGPLGYMIPPSMPAIIYGVVSDTSIGALFLATVIPGVLWGTLYMVINSITYKKWKTPPSEQELLDQKATGYWKELGSTAWKGIPAFIMPLIILGGIYGGIFTPTEAGAVSAVYALPVGLLIYGELRIRNMIDSFLISAKSCGVLMIIFAMVMVYTRILVLEGVPQSIAVWLTTITSNKYTILFILNIILLIAGMFLDTITIILIMTPLLTPALIKLGVDPVHLGAIISMNLGIGTFTPPMATGLFVASRVSGVPLPSILKPLWPFLFWGSIPILFLTTYVPWLSLWLPKIIMGSIVK